MRGLFIVRTVDKSMEPTHPKVSFANFEWHRGHQQDREIVIANIPTFELGQEVTEAVKRFREAQNEWVFKSDNLDYETIRLSKRETSYPILGTFISQL